LVDEKPRTSQPPNVNAISSEPSRGFSGSQLKQIVETVTSAFDLSSLTQELYFGMNVDLPNQIDVNRPFEWVVFQTVKWTEQQGRTLELVRILARVRPNKPEMQTLLQLVEGE
jgi:hypothetical protein